MSKSKIVPREWNESILPPLHLCVSPFAPSELSSQTFHFNFPPKLKMIIVFPGERIISYEEASTDYPIPQMPPIYCAVAPARRAEATCSVANALLRVGLLLRWQCVAFIM